MQSQKISPTSVLAVIMGTLSTEAKKNDSERMKGNQLEAFLRILAFVSPTFLDFSFCA